MFARYLTGLGPFLRHTTGLRQADASVRLLLEQRRENFLSLLRHSVFAFESSPYLPLFRHAGIDLDDVAELVRKHGLPAALERLYGAGVYVTLDEFKGRRSIRRGSLEYEVRYLDFDNPVGGQRFVSRTSGSGGKRRRLLMDLGVMEADACYHRLFVEAWGISRSPVAVWRPGPPDASGVRNCLTYVRAGQPVARWFSQTRFGGSLAGWRNATFAGATSAVAAGEGRRLPVPEFMPLSRADDVARWLAEQSALGRSGHLNTMVGSGIRVCLAARDLNLDIRGSVFRVGGEPLTRARARIFHDVGARVGSHYAMTEVGAIAMACAEADEPDEAHILDGKLALTTHPARPPSGGEQVSAFHLTTLHPFSPKLMVNVETGDCGTVADGDCGCGLGAAGLGMRVHSILSYEKLTSEGMTFLGSDVLELLEHVLPRAFGGTVADYQLVEEKAGGVPTVSLFVSPGVGPVEEQAALSTMRAFLAREDGGGRLMTGIWEQADTLRLVRREPLTTAAGKVLPLHVVGTTTV